MRTTKKIAAIVCAVAAVCLSMPNMAGSEGNSLIRKAPRAGAWEFYLPLSYAEDATIDGQQGSRAEINDDFGFGFGVGYNFNNHFQLGGLFNWNSRSYDATVVLDNGSTRNFSNYLETSSFSLNGTYYIFNSNITPFVSGAVGYTFVDTNIPDGPPSNTCWNDPFVGYVCTDYVPTKTESTWSYGGGLGVRWDFNRQFSMQCSYNKIWIDFDNSSGTPDFDSWRLDFVFRMF